MVAPRWLSTAPIGFATAIELLPANSRPTARGFVVTSSTIREPESPEFRNWLPLFATVDGRLPKQDLQTQMLSGAGHSVYFERPDEFNKIVIEFLRSAIPDG